MFFELLIFALQNSGWKHPALMSPEREAEHCYWNGLIPSKVGAQKSRRGGLVLGRLLAQSLLVAFCLMAFATSARSTTSALGSVFLCIGCSECTSGHKTIISSAGSQEERIFWKPLRRSSSFMALLLKLGCQYV